MLSGYSQASLPARLHQAELFSFLMHPLGLFQWFLFSEGQDKEIIIGCWQSLWRPSYYCAETEPLKFLGLCQGRGTPPAWPSTFPTTAREPEKASLLLDSETGWVLTHQVSGWGMWPNSCYFKYSSTGTYMGDRPALLCAYSLSPIFGSFQYSVCLASAP